MVQFLHMHWQPEHVQTGWAAWGNANVQGTVCVNAQLHTVSRMDTPKKVWSAYSGKNK